MMHICIQSACKVVGWLRAKTLLRAHGENGTWKSAVECLMRKKSYSHNLIALNYNFFSSSSEEGARAVLSNKKNFFNIMPEDTSVIFFSISLYVVSDDDASTSNSTKTTLSIGKMSLLLQHQNRKCIPGYLGTYLSMQLSQ